MKARKLIIKVITFTLFGLLIASFAVWGIGDIFRVNPQQVAIAEVGDLRIEQQDFARTLSREVNRISARLGGRFDLEQARALGVVDQVVGQMVSRALFDRKIADLGLTASEALLKRRITEEPAFSDAAGRFDRARFIQALQFSNMGEQEFLDDLRRDILRQQLVGAIAEAAPAPRSLAESLYVYRQETRTARVLRVPNASIQDLPEPDQAALEAFHREFSDRFMAPEFRAVTMIHLRAEDLAAEIAIPEAEVRAEYEDRREDFAVPERREVAQMVFNDQAEADKAMGRLREGASFETVAQDETGQAPVDLGSVARADLPEELAEPAFALKQGEVSDPVKTAFGWHILQVGEIIPGEEASFEAVREELAEDLAMSQAIDGLISIANQLDDELAAGASMDEAAELLNLKARRIAALDRDGRDAAGNLVPDLPGDRFTATVFETAPGEDSLLTETPDGGFFILRVDGVTPAQLRPLAEVRDQVVELWRDARRAEKTREIATALAARAQRGEALEDIGEAEGYEVTTSGALTRFDSDPTQSFAPALAGKLFDLAPNEVDTVAAPDGHIVFQLLEITRPDPANQETEVAALREGLSNAMRNDLLEQFIANLRGEYGVTVNQRAIDDVLASF